MLYYCICTDFLGFIEAEDCISILIMVAGAGGLIFSVVVLGTLR